MKILAFNKRAAFDYEIFHKVEAGIMLTGQEVKSARGGNMNLSGSYVSFVTGKALLKNAKIQPYKYGYGLAGYDPGRDRELLLHKKESAKLAGLSQEKGISIIPLEVRGGRMIKILLGVGRGRRKYDKRHRIREREMERKVRSIRHSRS